MSFFSLAFTACSFKILTRLSITVFAPIPYKAEEVMLKVLAASP
jgi:hypothetical protein